MGFRFRKSINLGGGFRVNISKSGIGYSWGVPGFRVTKTAKGVKRTTYSIPGTGISHVSESGKRKEKTHTNTVSDIVDKKTLNAGDISEYQTAEYQELLDGISNYKKWDMLSNILIATILLISMHVFILTAIAGIVLKIFVRKNLSIPMEYNFDAESKKEHDKMIQSWKSICTAKKVWQFTSSSDVRDKKYHAGAGHTVSRQRLQISESCPGFFRSNEKFITLGLKNETVILMPDKILIIKGTQVGAASYNTVSVNVGYERFIESEKVPSDAEIIDYTWEKVNKDGSPDKRFKGNRKLPICRYGLITLSSDTGMDIRICFSNNKLVDNFR